MRAYIEDARALAPEASGLAVAAAVAGRGGPSARTGVVDIRVAYEEGLANVLGQRGVDQALGTPADVERLQAEVAELRRAVSQATARSPEVAPAAVVAVRGAAGKVHVGLSLAAVGPRAGRVALCGWQLNPQSPYVEAQSAVIVAATIDAVAVGMTGCIDY